MYVAQSIILAIVVSIFVTLFGLNFSDELLRIMGSTEESIILTREYLDIIFFGAIIVLVQLSLNGTLNAQGDTKSYRNVLIFTFFLSSYAHLTPRSAVTFRRRCELQNNHCKPLININLLVIGQNLTSTVFVLGILISWRSDDLSPELSTVSVDKCECRIKRIDG